MGSNRALYVSALFVIFNLCCSSHLFDTITRIHFISDAENGSLVSSDGNFKLGFFSPGKSQARYVGIWLNKISEHTVVWVANRGNPIKNSAGVFKIGGDGNLAIFCGTEDNSLWSTNVSMITGTSTAKLLDSGNLVLVTEDKIVWQSFNYPTDTVIPGMKFGLNRNSGLNRILTSGKSIDDPTPGEYSLRLDTCGMPQVFLYKNSVPIERIVSWNRRKLIGLRDVKVKGHKGYYSDLVDSLNITYVSNDNEFYVIASPKNGAPLSIAVLEPTGTLKRLIWHESQRWMKMGVEPGSLCDEYARCGANAICNEDTLGRCICLPGFEPLNPQSWYPPCVETRKQDGCGKGDGEGFVRLEHVKLPEARNSTVYSNMSLQECERKCLKSCNCTGYAIVDAIESEQWCITWYGELKDIRDFEYGHDFYIRVDAVELDAWKVSGHIPATKSRLAFIIFPVITEIILVVVCFHYFWRRRAKGKKKQKHHHRLVLDLAGSSSRYKDFPNDSGESENIELTLFELHTVISATNNFSLANTIGRGGFGPVYKGQLSNGQKIAVKRLSKNSGQGISEFKNEVLLVAKLQHKNLVRLLGYCMEKDEKILIYEFMPNKSLDYFIFDQSRKLLLDWRMRFDIILGIARGILYLHQDSRLKIIHKDLKTSNILLDKEMKPKISDFGTARICGEDKTQEKTKRVVGTYGYMSPEYVLGGLFSTKSDIFSFGVIILEIISGKKRMSFYHDDSFSCLTQYTWELWRVSKALEIVDSCIAGSCPTNEVLRCIHVGLLCVQDNVEDRPSMSNIVFMLSNETILSSPKKSTFAIRKNESRSSLIRRECSINKVFGVPCLWHICLIGFKQMVCSILKVFSDDINFLLARSEHFFSNVP